MQLAAFVVIFSSSIVKICSAGVMVDSSKVDKSLVEASIDIFESCYANRTSTVGLAGASVGRIIETISSRNTVIPVTLIEEPSREVSHHPVDRASRYKLQVFLVAATEPSNLVKTLKQVKNTKWWNHMASFLLIDMADVENDCSSAPQMLLKAWEMNLLNAKFMCLHRTRGRLIYTFNPYANKASVPWRQEGTYKGISDHPWTLFAQEYREVDSRCDGLDFDKTLDLGGHEIRASVRGMEVWSFDDPDVKPTLFNLAQHVRAHLLMHFLNVTWKFRFYPEAYISLRDKNGNPIEVAAEAINGTSDICLNLLPQHIWSEFETTYPNAPGHVAVITQYPGHKTQLDKIISVLDKPSRFGVLVVLLITLLFFKFYQQKPLTSAILDLVLIICNAAIEKIPEKLAPRLYLTGLFIFVVTIQGIYSGVLAGLLTKQERLPAINSIEDLARSHHTIYGLRYYGSFFNESAFKGRWVELQSIRCTNYVLRDPKAACAQEELSLIQEASNAKVHLADNPVGTINGINLIRSDWPLEDRFNDIFGSATAGDLMNAQFTKQRDSVMRKLKAYEDEDQDGAPKVLTLKELTFAFVILAIGLGCATISFIIEVATFKLPVAKPRRRIRRQIRFIE